MASLMSVKRKMRRAILCRVNTRSTVSVAIWNMKPSSATLHPSVKIDAYNMYLLYFQKEKESASTVNPLP